MCGGDLVPAVSPRRIGQESRPALVKCPNKGNESQVEPEVVVDRHDPARATPKGPFCSPLESGSDSSDPDLPRGQPLPEPLGEVLPEAAGRCIPGTDALFWQKIPRHADYPRCTGAERRKGREGGRAFDSS
jgi:hypothetical protein